MLIGPGCRLGILGGGQLGRMLALAAARLGLDVRIFSDEADSPAARVAAGQFVAPYTDEAALLAFAKNVDCVTFEFENIPARSAQLLFDAGLCIHPNPRSLKASQDRLEEKRFLNALGIPTAPFAPIDGPGDLPAALAAIGIPAILKTRRLGYDGKGQARIARAADAEAALASLAHFWPKHSHGFVPENAQNQIGIASNPGKSSLDFPDDAIGGAKAILEGHVAFVREVSLIAARGQDGAFAAYDLSENTHENGVLSKSVCPAASPRAVQALARTHAERLAAELDYVGVFAIEFFELVDGRLLANEWAPRVHNTGHWTADACHTGQFEQHVRAVCGWPLGDPTRQFDAEMHNLLGAAAHDWADWASAPDARLWLYGKREALAGRKMGHVTQLIAQSGVNSPSGR